MILKHILGKSIDAAKKTARQMYGDDFLILDSVEGDENRQAKITIFSDKEPNVVEEKTETVKQAVRKPSPKKKAAAGVEYVPRSNRRYETKRSGDKLNSLRKIAEQIEKKEFTSRQADGETEENLIPEKPKDLYSRASIRPKNQAEDKPEKSTGAAGKKETEKKEFAEQSSIGERSYSRIELPPRNDQREITALHKRFDKLEALLDSAFISANLDYASHPAFQQLVHTGINSSVIAGWFSRIVSSGVDPFDQPEQFMTALAEILRNALGQKASKAPKKFMLFVGPSGAGKTNLIMKLAAHPELLMEKNIAVASVFPPENDSRPYYTILEPYCENYKIPYFKIREDKDINTLLDEFENFDHVLIDTPSFNLQKESSFREFWTIRQLLAPLAPLEIHYVINASMSKFYFRNSSATHHPLKPDFVAITHLDEVSQWGPIIPFLETMGCTARYISRGKDLPNSIAEFNPQWFAQKILQEN